MYVSIIHIMDLVQSIYVGFIKWGYLMLPPYHPCYYWIFPWNKPAIFQLSSIESHWASRLVEVKHCPGWQSEAIPGDDTGGFGGWHQQKPWEHDGVAMSYHWKNMGEWMTMMVLQPEPCFTCFIIKHGELRVKLPFRCLEIWRSKHGLPFKKNMKLMVLSWNTKNMMWLIWRDIILQKDQIWSDFAVWLVGDSQILHTKTGVINHPQMMGLSMALGLPPWDFI